MAVSGQRWSACAAAASRAGHRVGRKLQPFLERQCPIVEEHADVVEHFRRALDAETAGPQGREDLGVPHEIAVDVVGQHDDKRPVDVEADTARPAVSLAQAVCRMAGPSQPWVVESRVLPAVEPGEVTADVEQRGLKPAGSRRGGRGGVGLPWASPGVVPACLGEDLADVDGGD